MSAHATLSASGSAKWLACPAALALESMIDAPDTGGPWADEGTAAHHVLEMCLSKNISPSSMLGDVVPVDSVDKNGEKCVNIIKVNQEMVNAVEVTIEYVERLMPKNAFYELKVNYTHIAPEGFGTADIILEVYEKIGPGLRINKLYIIDFKYGKGVRVEAVGNTQGRLYAIGALADLDMMFDKPIESVVVVIAQPRMDNICEEEISVADLLAWGEEQKPKAQLAWDLLQNVKKAGGIDDEGYTDNTALKAEHFNPSKKACQWCQGKRQSKCKAQALQGYSAAVEGFDDLSAEAKIDLPKVKVAVKDPWILDTEDLAAIYFNMKIFISFCSGIEEEIIKRIADGESVPGVKVVPTPGNRAWRGDEAETEKALRTAGLQKKHYQKVGLISPTEAEKALKKVKPKEYKRRYRKLEETAIYRPVGHDKLVEDLTPKADVEGFDDLLS